MNYVVQLCTAVLYEQTITQSVRFQTLQRDRRVPLDAREGEATIPTAFPYCGTRTVGVLRVPSSTDGRSTAFSYLRYRTRVLHHLLAFSSVLLVRVFVFLCFSAPDGDLRGPRWARRQEQALPTRPPHTNHCRSPIQITAVPASRCTTLPQR